MLAKFSERFKKEKTPGVSFVSGSSKTKQSYKKDCDINHIMKKYRETGLLPQPSPRQPFFGDFTNKGDFLAQQNAIAETRQYFERLPALTREKFMNDPARMLDFLADEANNEEAVKLGLKPAPEPPPAAAAAAPAAGTTPPPSGA